MTLSVALLAAKAKLPIAGYESISISYPDYDKHLSSLWKE
jgi:5-enolpyruvylshikimate-3-phosphate synthase